MGKKDKRSGNPFGLTTFLKSLTLSENRLKGRIAEDSFAMSQRLQGHDVKKIHKGGDFVVQKRDFLGREIGRPTTYEVKTGDSPLTDAQKRKKRTSRKYKVVRY